MSMYFGGGRGGMPFYMNPQSFGYRIPQAAWGPMGNVFGGSRYGGTGFGMGMRYQRPLVHRRRPLPEDDPRRQMMDERRRQMQMHRQAIRAGSRYATSRRGHHTDRYRSVI